MFKKEKLYFLKGSFLIIYFLQDFVTYFKVIYHRFDSNDHPKKYFTILLKLDYLRVSSCA